MQTKTAQLLVCIVVSEVEEKEEALDATEMQKLIKARSNNNETLECKELPILNRIRPLVSLKLNQNSHHA